MTLKLQFKFWLCHYFIATFNVVIYCMRNNSTWTHSFFYYYYLHIFFLLRLKIWARKIAETTPS